MAALASSTMGDVFPTQRGAAEPGSSINLTERETQVLRGMSQGKSNGQIGRERYESVTGSIATLARFAQALQLSALKAA